MKRFLIELQNYEIENVLSALRHEIQTEQYANCKWEYQDKINMFYYTPNKKVKQLEFTIKSINRQMKPNADPSV